MSFREKGKLRRLFTNKKLTPYLMLAAFVMCTLNSVMTCHGSVPGDPPPSKANDISCYNVTSDALPEITEMTLNGTKNIFLVETSCKGYLESRQACAVKSAARAHPDWQIYLLFVGPVTNEKLNTGILSSLQFYENVVIARVNFSKIVKDTPLERILSENLLERSEYRYAHASDIIRLLLLRKFGGVYIDLDIVVLKAFDDLGPDFAGLDAPNSVNTAVLGISNSSIGRKLATAAVTECANLYNPNSYLVCGSKLLTKLLFEFCNTTNITDAIECKGFKVYSEETFYPIPAQNWQEYFKPGVFHTSRFNNSYTAHVLNSLSHVIKDRTIKPWTLYANMARIFCPSVYE